MATTTKITAIASRYGYFDNAAYTNSGHLYVGKNPDTGNTYSARATFPSLRSIEAIGDASIVITKVTFVVHRDAGTKASTVTVGPSADGSWGAARDGVASLSIPAKTAWYTFDITHCAEAILNYSNPWYIHLTGTGTQVRFNGIEPVGGEPIIYVTWEYAASTITTGTDSTELGTPATFTITPEEGDHSFSLSYSFEGESGTIATSTTNTSLTWTPPITFASKLPNSSSGEVSVTMTVYDASGAQIRTEILFVTVTVPESLKVEIMPSTYTYNVSGGNSNIYLAGKTSLGISPVLNVNNSYGATVKSLVVEVENGSDSQVLTWNNFFLDSEVEGAISPQGYYVSNSQTTAIFKNAGTVSLTFIATDSRGFDNIVTKTYTVHSYNNPKINAFEVERYEAIYNEETGAISGYTPSDIGENVWVTLQAECTPITVDGTSRNNLSWIITAVNSNGSTNTYTGGGNSTTINHNDNRNLINITVPTSIAIDYTLQVYDTMNYSEYQYSSVALGRANFALAGSKYGASFGCLPKGTEENPMLESAYPIHAYGGVSFAEESSAIKKTFRFFHGSEAERDAHSAQNGDIWFVVK
jgi:hypothetical protein